MYIREFIEIDEAHSGSYTAQTVIPSGKKEIINAARFPWGGAFASNAVDLEDKIINSGQAALMDVVAKRLVNIQTTIRKYLGYAVHASRGTDPKGILGLDDIFNTDKAVAYGKITENQLAKWSANVITDSDIIGLGTMQKIRRAASVGEVKSKQPNLYLTTPELKDGYTATLSSQARLAMDGEIANAGFDNVLFEGQPVVSAGKDMLAEKRVEALNTNYLSMKTHRDFPFTSPTWVPVEGKPDAAVANVRWVGQLACSHRAAHARHTNVSTPEM